MRISFKRIVSLFIFSLVACYCNAQNSFFSDAPENSFINPAQKRVIIPAGYRTLQLNKTGLLSFLNAVISEKNVRNRANAPVIEIPMPGGGTTKFHIWESSVMEPGLAAKFPDIKTYTGQGIDDPTANIKLDITQFGFHAMIISSLKGAVFIDPYARGNTEHYISYNKADFKKKEPFFELPPIKNLRSGKKLSGGTVLAASCIGTQLRTYRLALAATAEYTTAQGGTVAAAQAAQVTTMNRVNGVYEREVDIRMVLVANNNLLIYTNSDTDPYSNSDGSTMLDENQTNITSVIGNANYDIGHVFSTGGGGVAILGVVCVEGFKAMGVTGSPSPSGDPFDIDYVAHEMGHQFGANHTFNSETGSCGGGNWSSTTNAEPGSGSTIMAYAGICGSDNLQGNSDAQFQAISFNEITAYSIIGDGNSCAVKTATGNTSPVVNAGADYTIPKSTPFTLTGNGTDANGDQITYSWEQVDVGGPSNVWNTPSGDDPLFRSFAPKASPVRFFPKLADITNNTTTIGELLPAYARVMHFRLTARDNRAGGGGVCFDENTVTVNATAGPFFVTYPNTAGIAWIVNDFKTVTWDPSGTAAAPISCTNVKIELSLDGGLTYPVTILANTPNDGKEEIQVPNNVTSSGRIRITSVGNVFYDISNVNFAIQSAPTPAFAFNNPDGPVGACGTASLVATLKTASLNGLSTAINLTATGNPDGTSVAISNPSLTPGGTTTITLTKNAGSLANGIYNITITGVSGAVSRTKVIPFELKAVPVAPANFSAPANGAAGVSVLPSFNFPAVPGAITYTIEISKNSSFNPIIQTVTNITSLPWALTSPLADNTQYYWRATATSSCGSSPVSAAGFFKTGIFTCKSSTDVPQAITENGTPVITSTLVIPPASGVTIADLNVVGLTGTHSFVKDLTVLLTSPAGTTVILWNAICTEQDQNFDINLDDEATIAIPCPPTGNRTAKPQNLLSAFDGQNSTGTWILTIKDNADGDGGVLTGWGLTINNCAFTTTPVTYRLCPPAATTSITSNLTGTAYQWQADMGNGFVNITNNANYSGANTITLQITNAPSSWTGYQYRCLVNGNNSAVSAIGFTSYWTGSVSSAWETAANWSCNAIPDANTDVFINSGTAVVKSNAVCRSIEVNPGASVTVNAGFKITVNH